MQEIMKNDLVELLDAGIIYPIPDSEWVSLIYAILNKKEV